MVDALAALRRWPREEGLPELIRLCEGNTVVQEDRDCWTAFELAAEIERITPGETMVERLRSDFANPISITTDPPGAQAFAAYYEDPPGQEIALGTTPLQSISFPRGLTRLRLEMPRPPHRARPGVEPRAQPDQRHGPGKLHLALRDAPAVRTPRGDGGGGSGGLPPLHAGTGPSGNRNDGRLSHGPASGDESPVQALRG